jgi:hypothetical protein
MSNSILYVLNYFAQFSYPPTIEEVYLFLNKKTNEREFNLSLKTLLANGKVIKNENRIATDKLLFAIFKERLLNSQKLLQTAAPLLIHLKYIPNIKFVGISGSLSMHNTSKEGDVDLFVITGHNAIWQTRFLILLYKYILFLVNRPMASKLCFNLFFSETGLLLSNSKQNEYTGHELLQLKPLINKEHIYENLLNENRWILKTFPNVTIPTPIKSNGLSQRSKMGYLFEAFLRNIQVMWLRRNGYSWKYKGQQLWLIQEDFQDVVLYNNPNNMS